MDRSIRRHGLTQLCAGEVDGQPPTVDIVFVHGLFGHPYWTWASLGKNARPDVASNLVSSESTSSRSSQFWKKPRFLVPRKTDVSSLSSADTLVEDEKVPAVDVFWLQDLLPKALPSARIFTWGYDVDLGKFLLPTSTMSVSQHAETLLSDLSDVRTTYRARSTRIIFVAHSLGGIVVKRALCLSAISKTHLGEVLKHTAGVCFLGTPHRGARVASWGTLALDISKVFLRQPNMDVMRSLKDNSEALQTISQDFGRLLADRTFRIYSFREEYAYHGIMIVDSFSSAVGDGHEDCSTIPSNHRDMTKFASITDTGFVRISGVLKNWEGEWRMHRETSCLRSITQSETSLRLDSVEAPFESTYGWMLEDDSDVKVWLEDKRNNMFWISGVPGCGKSTAMKYVMRQSKTRQILSLWDERDWTIAGFFFHELGTQIQRSVGGLYAEILFRILRVHRRLLSLIAEPIYPAKCEEQIKSAGPRTQINHENIYVNWTEEELRDILLACVKQREVDANICLFIDALDEHSGDHRQLVSFLKTMVQEADPQHVRIKICVASRPENIFKDNLGQYPGIAMHTKTRSDISKYVYGKLEPELSRYRRQTSSSAIQGLVEEIVDNAHGVFLWVTLVVPELVEGICDGDTMQELRGLLYTIPPKLSDVYGRALGRKERRKLPETMKKRRNYERWILFRVAACAPQSIPLDTFMDVAAFNVLMDFDNMIKQSVKDKAPKREDAEEIRRLTVRTNGLIDNPFDRMYIRYTIRFIHQTVEEFLRTPQAYNLLSEGLPKDYLHGGQYFLDRYWLFSRNYSQIDDLLPYEKIALATIIADLAPAPLATFSANVRRIGFPDSLVSLVQPKEPYCDSGLLLAPATIYTYWAQGHSFSSLFARSESKLTQHGGNLIETVVKCTALFQGPDNEILRNVLKAGIHPDAGNQGRTALDVVLSSALYLPRSEVDMDYLAALLTILLEFGAEPNQEMTCWEKARPVHVAAKGLVPQCLELLKTHGADLSRVDGYGKTCLDYLPDVYQVQDPTGDGVWPSAEIPMIIVTGQD